jgi:hypothetical protein
MAQSAGNSAGGGGAQPPARRRRAYLYDAGDPRREPGTERARLIRLAPEATGRARPQRAGNDPDDDGDALDGGPGNGRLFRHDAA